MKTDLKIFLVDDDPVYRNIYAYYLKTLGYDNICQFADGLQCVNNLAQSPDIILLDHQMQVMNGTETLQKIKRYNPGILVIYLSGENQLDVAIEALKYGAFDYIIKGSVNEKQRVSDVLNKIMEARKNTAIKNPGKWNRYFPWCTNKLHSRDVNWLQRFSQEGL